jgi:transcriptional regulator with XRE-family HTH domain
MKDQIIKLMEAENMTPAKFADEIGVQRSSISHILGGRNKPSFDFISKILERFQGINAEWLLTGKGSMIKTSGSIPEAQLKQASLFDQPVTKREQIEKTNEYQTSPNKVVGNKAFDYAEKGKSTTIENLQSSNNLGIKGKITNVNNVDHIVFFYSDGTFEKYIPR